MAPQLKCMQILNMELVIYHINWPKLTGTGGMQSIDTIRTFQTNGTVYRINLQRFK